MNRAEKTKELLRKTFAEPPGESGPSPMDERVLSDASTNMKQAVAVNGRIRRTFLWRTIMKNSMTRWATAAVIMVAVMVGGFHFDGSFDGSSVAFADVIRSIQQAKSAIWREHRVMTCDGEELPFLESDVVRYYSLEHGGREDMYNVADLLLHQVYWLAEENERIEVIPFLKRYIRNELTEAERAFNGKSVETLVELVKSEESRKLGRRRIDGIETEGFEVRASQIAGALIPIEHENLVARFWIDVETSLPVRYEAELVTTDKRLTFLTDGKAVEIEVVGDQPEWDVELEPGVFEPNIPDDYIQLEL